MGLRDWQEHRKFDRWNFYSCWHFSRAARLPARRHFHCTNWQVLIDSRRLNWPDCNRRDTLCAWGLWWTHRGEALAGTNRNNRVRFWRPSRTWRVPNDGPSLSRGSVKNISKYGISIYIFNDSPPTKSNRVLQKSNSLLPKNLSNYR